MLVLRRVWQALHEIKVLLSTVGGSKTPYLVDDGFEERKKIRGKTMIQDRPIEADLLNIIPRIKLTVVENRHESSNSKAFLITSYGIINQMQV